jgi:DNA-binding NarL/FixJ family response regulator
LIVDDHDIVRFGVRMLLSKDARWDICGEAADGKQAIEEVRRLHPDVVSLQRTVEESKRALTETDLKESK